MLHSISIHKPNFHKISIIVRGKTGNKKEKRGIWKESNNINIEYSTYGLNNKLPCIGLLLAGIRALIDKSELTVINTPGAAVPFCLLNNLLPKKKKVYHPCNDIR